MELLIPSQLFLRVKEKNYAHFAHKDMALDRDALAVYLRLFSLAIDSGSVRLPQSELAADCRICVRALQNALRRLAELGYIAVECAPGRCCFYHLLLSPRVLARIRKYDLIDNPAWYARARRSSGRASGVPVAQPPHGLRGGYAPHAHPSYKEDKREKSAPLSPLPAQRPRENASSRKPFPAVAGSPLPATAGGGDSFSRKKRQGKASTFQAANVLFERLYAAYPRKEAKEPARAIWHQLWRRGAIPALDALLAALERFRASASWTKEHGRFVPHLVNWLRGQRWLDEAPAASTPAAAPVSTPKNSEHIRRCVERLEDQHRTDPTLEEARPVFEKFLSCFADGQRKRGPAWGLWSLLYRRGKAPTVVQASRPSDMEVLSFLQDWQRGAHVAA